MAVKGLEARVVAARAGQMGVGMARAVAVAMARAVEAEGEEVQRGWVMVEATAAVERVVSRVGAAKAVSVAAMAEVMQAEVPAAMVAAEGLDPHKSCALNCCQQRQ